jgi:hypothetical protein
MNRQLSAERTRRAVITESEGTRQSAINVAEGTKQSEILKAEGDRQAAILRAEGFALALTQIYNAASQIDQKTMALQYLEAFKALGASPSTKYVLPLEITQLAESFRGFLVAVERERRRWRLAGGGTASATAAPGRDRGSGVELVGTEREAQGGLRECHDRLIDRPGNHRRTSTSEASTCSTRHREEVDDGHTFREEARQHA